MKKYILFEEEQKYLTLYHGTDSSKIKQIEKEGLKTRPNLYIPGWYMLSTTKPSAIFHATYAPEENRLPYLITFKIPIIETNPKRWDGFPYVWKPHVTNKYKWFGLKEPLPKEFIFKIEPIKFAVTILI